MLLNNPWLLWLALTLPAILALYILKPRRKQTVIPSTLLWRPAATQLEASRPWQRLRSNLLLWLQLFAAALLVLAAAGPVWNAATASRSTIVLLDTSASMRAEERGGTRFDSAREEVVSLAAGLRGDATITVIAFDRQPRVVVRESTDPGQVRRVLEQITPSACAGLPVPALSLARALARQYENPRLVLVSDGGLNISGNDIEFIAVGEGDASVAIAALRLRSTGSGQAAQVTVVNHGSRPASGTVALLKGQYPAGSKQWRLEPGQSTHLLWTDLPRDVTVQAQLKPARPNMDLLETDNRAWAVPEGKTKRKILLVSNGNIFLERVLQLIPYTEVYRADPAKYAIMLHTGAYPYDITVLDGLPGPLPPGAALLLDPPGGSPAPELTVGAVVNRVQLVPEPGSPLLAHVDLSDVNVRDARVLQAGAGWSTDIQSGGRSLFVHGTVGGRRLAVWSVDLHRSDLPLRPAFPVLVQNTVEWLLPAGLGVSERVQPGDEVQIMLPPLARRLVVEDAAGNLKELAPPYPPAPWVPDEPGLYRLIAYRDDGSVVREIAVNGYNAGEAGLKVRDPRQAGSAAVTVTEDGPAAKAERALPLARWLALAALLVIIIEWGVAGRGR